MTRRELTEQIHQKQSFLCIGLDTDIQKIPSFLLDADDPVFEFNKRIIDATKDYCVAYKPNTAFYESMGASGWESLRKTLEYIPDGLFTIADAKRGDIGNTSSMYARAFFEHLHVDSVTVAPYMGSDSVRPFLEFPGKWVILLALTSNSGSEDFQVLETKQGGYLFEQVLRISSSWGTPDNLMFVVGATKASMLKDIRRITPDHFLLVPGVGAQGGSLEEVARFGMNDQCGLLVNASRSIIYASQAEDFAEKAGNEARRMQLEMSTLLRRYIPA